MFRIDVVDGCPVTKGQPLPVFIDDGLVKMMAHATREISIEWVLLGLTRRRDNDEPFKGLRVEAMLVPRAWSNAAHTEVESVTAPTGYEWVFSSGIHSHHKMGAFFSPEDKARINKSFAFSLVVATNGRNTDDDLLKKQAEVLGFHYKAQVKTELPCGKIGRFDAFVVPMSMYDEYPAVDWTTPAVVNDSTVAACSFRRKSINPFRAVIDTDIMKKEVPCGLALPAIVEADYELADTSPPLFVQDKDEASGLRQVVYNGDVDYLSQLIRENTLKGHGHNAYRHSWTSHRKKKSKKSSWASQWSQRNRPGKTARHYHKRGGYASRSRSSKIWTPSSHENPYGDFEGETLVEDYESGFDVGETVGRQNAWSEIASMLPDIVRSAVSYFLAVNETTEDIDIVEAIENALMDVNASDEIAQEALDDALSLLIINAEEKETPRAEYEARQDYKAEIDRYTAELLGDSIGKDKDTSE